MSDGRSEQSSTVSVSNVTPSKHIVAIGAHAGDMDLTTGAVLAKYVLAGHRATLLHLTLGERGHPRVAPAEYAVQKREEATEFARRIGADVRFCAWEDGLLPADDAAAMTVADILRELRPDILLTHWSASMHKDHANAHRIATDARFYAGLAGLERSAPPVRATGPYLADNWEDAEGFTPTITVAIPDAAFGVWSDAITCYSFARGETYGFPYVDYYRALAVVRGAPAGFVHGQSFAVVSHALARGVEFLHPQE